MQEQNFMHWSVAHRNEKDASDQSASQSSLNDFLQTWVTCLVASEQGCDVEGQLSDGPKGCIDHSTNSKVTLGSDTADGKTMITLYVVLAENGLFFVTMGV